MGCGKIPSGVVVVVVVVSSCPFHPRVHIFLAIRRMGCFDGLVHAMSLGPKKGAIKRGATEREIYQDNLFFSQMLKTARIAISLDHLN